MKEISQTDQLVERLEQLERRLAAVESRHQNTGNANAGGAEPTPSPVPFEILGVDGKTIERTAESAQFSWKLTIESFADKPLLIDARIQLVDMNSFAVVEEQVPELLLEPGIRQKFSGIRELSTELEDQVMGVKGWVTLRS